MQPYCCANALEEAATGNRCCTWLPSDCRCPILVPPSPNRLLEVDGLQGSWRVGHVSGVIVRKCLHMIIILRL
jgi:hypothetical protein